MSAVPSPRTLFFLTVPPVMWASNASGGRLSVGGIAVSQRGAPGRASEERT